MDALERYIHDFSSPEEELLHELDRQTHLQVVQPRMLSGQIQGKLLELLVRMLRPRNILEIGTFTGYPPRSSRSAMPFREPVREPVVRWSRAISSV